MGTIDVIKDGWELAVFNNESNESTSDLYLMAMAALYQ